MIMSARDAQAQLEAIVVRCLGRAMAIVGVWLEAAVAAAAGVATDGQREGVDRLHLIMGLPAHHGQALLDRRLDRPQIGRLSHEQAAVAQLREEDLIMGADIDDDVFVRAALDELTTGLDDDHLLVGQGGGEAAPSDAALYGNGAILLADQARHSG